MCMTSHIFEPIPVPLKRGKVEIKTAAQPELSRKSSISYTSFSNMHLMSNWGGISIFFSNGGISNFDFQMGVCPKISKIYKVLEGLVLTTLFGILRFLTWMDKGVVGFVQIVGKPLTWIKPIFDDLTETGLSEINQLCEKFVGNPPTSLIKFMSRTCCSKETDSCYRSVNTCLLLILLVKCAANFQIESLEQPFKEAFENFHFINERKRPNDIRTKVARDLWLHGHQDSHWFLKEIGKTLPQVPGDESALLEIGLTDKMHKAFNLLLLGTASEEWSLIQWLTEDYVDSVDSLCSRLSQVFVDILLLHLQELPDIIPEYLFQCPFKKYVARLRISSEVVLKLELLKTSVPWLHEYLHEDTDTTEVIDGHASTKILLELV